MPRMFLSVVVGLALAASARADVKPHALFTDHAVLQRGRPIPVWGTASPGEKVTVTFRGTDVSTNADAEGKWRVELPAQKAGGPYELAIKGNNTVTFSDVLVGEVWICSGQSNMEWSLKSSGDAAKNIAGARNESLRLFTVPRRAVVEPQADVAAEWKTCTPEHATNFSAVGYHFGRDLQKALGVPVGLIFTAWGGTPAQAWTSKEALNAEPSLRYYRESLEANIKRYDPAKSKADYEERLKAHKDAVAKAKAEGKASPRPPLQPVAPGASPGSPSSLYNGMIAPIVPYAFEGAIWYQGESNAPRAFEYRTLFPAMIKDWRARWGREFPFLCVQLAPFNAGNPGGPQWAELREAQLLATQTLPKVGMAVITDCGERNDIHPRAKEPVGQRLALLARKIAYGEEIYANGPLYKSMKVEGDKVVLSFDWVGAGLEVRGPMLTGFTIAGSDREFKPAQAEVRDDKVVVWAEGVDKPVAVRFGWANYPEVNLFNRVGLPATPFRTDDWPLTTAPKKAG